MTAPFQNPVGDQDAANAAAARAERAAVVDPSLGTLKDCVCAEQLGNTGYRCTLTHGHPGDHMRVVEHTGSGAVELSPAVEDPKLIAAIHDVAEAFDEADTKALADVAAKPPIESDLDWLARRAPGVGLALGALLMQADTIAERDPETSKLALAACKRELAKRVL